MCERTLAPLDKNTHLNVFLSGCPAQWQRPTVDNPEPCWPTSVAPDGRRDRPETKRAHLADSLPLPPLSKYTQLWQSGLRVLPVGVNVCMCRSVCAHLTPVSDWHTPTVDWDPLQHPVTPEASKLFRRGLIPSLTLQPFICQDGNKLCAASPKEGKWSLVSPVRCLGQHLLYLSTIFFLY